MNIEPGKTLLIKEGFLETPGTALAQNLSTPGGNDAYLWDNQLDGYSLTDGGFKASQLICSNLVINRALICISVSKSSTKMSYLHP